MIAAGGLAVSFAFSTTLVSVVILGVILLCAAAVQWVAGVFARSWGGVFISILLSTLYAVAGFFAVQQPQLAAETLTLLLAGAFLFGGFFRVMVAASVQFPSWGWVLVNGFVTSFLGVLIWLQWPNSTIWVIGTFVGIDLIFNGLTWVDLASGARDGDLEPAEY
jgi:uncharacterized membrane protein HdeD (DUF308 family)